MNKLFIKSVNCDAQGGCGPCSIPVVVAEAEFTTENGEHFFISLAEVGGLPNFYKTQKSTFKAQIDEDDDLPEDELAEIFNNNTLFAGEYEELFENPDDEFMPVYRYLIYIVRADWDECKEYIKATEGKYLDDIDIPVSDIEEDYCEEFDEDEEDE